MVEELCRALSSSSCSPVEVTEFWEQLLGGPLTALLQRYMEQGVLCTQACNILATISPQSMDNMKVSIDLHSYQIMPLAW